MAIRKQIRSNLKCIEIISERDDALDTDKCDFEKYRENLNQEHLKFLPDKQPTVFVCNFELKGREAEWVKNSMLGGKDEDGSPKVALGSWSHRVVKYTLKDIRNPIDLKEEEKIIFRKDQKDYVHDDVIVTLDNLGIVSEIFGHYSNQVLGGFRAQAKNS